MTFTKHVSELVEDDEEDVEAVVVCEDEVAEAVVEAEVVEETLAVVDAAVEVVESSEVVVAIVLAIVLLVLAALFAVVAVVDFSVVALLVDFSEAVEEVVLSALSSKFSLFFRSSWLSTRTIPA